MNTVPAKKALDSIQFLLGLSTGPKPDHLNILLNESGEIR